MKPKQQRKEEVNARQKERKKRGPAEQLHRLDRKLGKGIGAERERMKLMKKIEQTNKKKKKGG